MERIQLALGKTTVWGLFFIKEQASGRKTSVTSVDNTLIIYALGHNPALAPVVGLDVLKGLFYLDHWSPWDHWNFQSYSPFQSKKHYCMEPS